jgi:hypothetical protein
VPSGRVNGAKIYREGWRSPLNLTAQILKVRIRRGRVASEAGGAPGGGRGVCVSEQVVSCLAAQIQRWGAATRVASQAGGVVECEVLDRASGYVIVTRASGRVVHLWDSTASIAGSSSTPANWHIL